MDDLERRVRQDERVIEAARRADIAKLKEKDEWRLLKLHWESTKERIERMVARRIMSGDKVSQTEIDFKRGAIWGIDWLLSQPDGAESRLEKAIEAALADALTEGD